MNKTIKLPIVPTAKLLVEVGSSVTPKTTIFEVKEGRSEQVIQLSNLLRIKASAISKYLKKKVGQKVEKGDILAEKRSFFSTFFIKSPINGTIKNINLKKGTLTLADSSISKRSKITLPVNGKVVTIGKNSVEVEIEGEVLKTQKGKGDDTYGALLCFPKERVCLFDIDIAVSGCIVFCKKVTDEIAVKLEVLGTTGLILQRGCSEILLPWVQVGEEVARKLEKHKDKRVWLRPEEKEIVILERSIA